VLRKWAGVNGGNGARMIRTLRPIGLKCRLIIMLVGQIKEIAYYSIFTEEHITSVVPMNTDIRSKDMQES
jgi:hypothetical protein